MCRAAGADLSVVESLVSHSSPEMTRSYTHSDYTTAHKAVAKLPDVMADEDEQPSMDAWAAKHLVGLTTAQRKAVLGHAK